MMKIAPALAALSLLAACSSATESFPDAQSTQDAEAPVDAAVQDVEMADISTTDAGPNDSGPADTGPADTGSADAADLDAEAMDAGQSTLTPGEHERRFTTVDGERRYLIYIPSGLSDSAPVLLALHGGGGSAEGQRDGPGLNALADTEKFIVLYPEGIPASGGGIGSGPTATWNAGTCCGDAVANNVDDVAFIASVLDDLATVQSYDAARVYSTGFSNGAMMTYRLGCELSDRIAAIAPVGGHPDSYVCTPPRYVPIMHTHGTADTCANYDGGPMCGGCFQRFVNAAFGLMLPVPTSPCEPVVDEIAELRTRYGCEATSTVDYMQGTAQCETWQCAENSEIRFCPIVGMGHSWPSGADPSFCRNPNSAICQAWLAEAGASNNDMDNREIWSFLSRFSL